MSQQDLISVVITTYNRSDALGCVLRALSHQDDGNFEVVVADDGSTPSHQAVTREALGRMTVPCAHVWHPDIGFTASQVRNLGVAASRGAYIVLLDGDCVPDTDFIRQHRRLREPGCFVNGSRVMLSPQMTQSVLEQLTEVTGQPQSFWWKHWRNRGASKFSGTWRLPDWSLRRQQQFVWKGIRSCNMGVWRQDYAAVDGFDESFVGWGHEDADFVLRLHNLGLTRKNGFFATEVYHLWHRESSRAAESDNARRVRERMASGQVRAVKGLHNSATDGDVALQRWG